MNSLVSNSDEAEEMAQDLAVVVLAHRAVPVDPRAFAGWCYWVARNVAAHRRRSDARRRARLEDDSEIALNSVWPDDDPERMAECRQRLEAYVGDLDEEALTLLFQRFVLEETSAEIAVRLSISAASVRMRLARLMAALRD